MNPQNYTINIRPGWGISPVVKVSQGDVGRPLAFTIMDGQDALTIASGTTITIKGTKPSTLGFTQACELSGNTASVETTATMTQEAGAVQAELILTQGTTVIGSANFVMYVEPAAHPEGTTDGDAETARDLMTRATAAVEQAETAAQSASDSAASIAQAGIDASTATSGQVPTANGSGGWSWDDPAGGGTSDDITNASSVSGSTVTDALDTLSDEIANLEGGAPTPAATVSAMVDTTRIYLYTGSETGYTAGHWYYYSNGSWVDGGEYGAVNSNVFSDYAKETLITILRSAMYTSDQSGNINRLEDALARQVTAISATIDLGGNTIYTDDELDMLRQYLTVTATYDDMTTSPVTGYALSGTLVAGTSTITITYQGNSTTVSIPVSQAVVRYAITYSLTGVTSSNTDTNIAEGNTFTTTLTAETAGYIPTEVAVTMGGADVTATAYDALTHVVTIANVSGAISITAVEAEDPTLPVYVLASPMTESGNINYSLFDQDRDWTIELTVDTPANSGALSVNNRVEDISYYPVLIYVQYVNGISQVKIWNSNTALNTSWLDGTIAGTQKVVITHDADGNSIGYWKQTNMKSGRESYGQGSKTLAVGTTITPNNEPFTVSISGGATLSDFKVYKRVLTNEEISEYVGWTVE